MAKPFLLLLGLLSFLTGCMTGGDFRRISVSEDLSPGDLAYFRKRAESSDAERVEDATIGIPLLFLPLVSFARETYADRVEADRLHFRVEDDRGLGIFLLRMGATGTFDDEGRNLSYRRSVTLAFGVVSTATGHAYRVGGGAVPTSAFSLLWGLFSTERTPVGRSWTFLWFPIVSARGPAAAADQ